MLILLTALANLHFSKAQLLFQLSIIINYQTFEQCTNVFIFENINFKDNNVNNKSRSLSKNFIEFTLHNSDCDFNFITKRFNLSIYDIC